MVIGDGWIFIHVPKTGGTSIEKALGGRNFRLPYHAPHWYTVRELGPHFTFGFLRNPWARAVSYYRFMTRDQKPDQRLSFKHWIMLKPFYMPQDMWYGGDKLPSVHRRPQMWWLDGCDFIGRFEQLESDLNTVLERLGEKPVRLERMHTTTGRDWRLEYDTETRAYIAEVFAEDIAEGGYTFEAA